MIQTVMVTSQPVVEIARWQRSGRTLWLPGSPHPRPSDLTVNAALHQIVVVRLRYDEATRAYFSKRKAEGKSKKEIFRCLKSYVARQVYRTLVDPREEASRSVA